MITFIMKYIMLRAIFQFFLKMLNLFATSINIGPLSGAETNFGHGGSRKYKIIKLHFAPKLASIYTLHEPKCSMENRK